MPTARSFGQSGQSLADSLRFLDGTTTFELDLKVPIAITAQLDHQTYMLMTLTNEGSFTLTPLKRGSDNRCQITDGAIIKRDCLAELVNIHTMLEQKPVIDQHLSTSCDLKTINWPKMKTAKTIICPDRADGFNQRV
jgi:hypothetical protein